MSKRSRSAKSSSSDAAVQPLPEPAGNRTKYQKGVVEVVPRASLVNADYNPRRISPASKARLKANIKEVGLLGPAIVWNRRTGNVLSGHQRLAVLDALEEESGGDYSLEVTVVDFAPKREREQNIFMNSQDAQGEFDVDAVINMLTDDELGIDPAKAGLDRITVEAMLDMSGVDLDVEGFFGESRDSEATKAIKTEAEKIASIKNSDSYRREKLQERQQTQDCYVTMVFENNDQLEAFLDALGLPIDDRYVDGTTVAELLEIPLEPGDEDPGDGEEE